MKNVMNLFDKQVEKSALFQKRKGSGRKNGRKMKFGLSADYQ
ncbi:hypothetical protein [Prevotella sp. oral taxon 820]|nr:hypothetical protein [Prevotella sp. oral taxon 820]